MTRYANIPAIAIFFILVLFCGVVYAESLTITTYYPSPYGSYNELYVTSKLGVGTTSPGQVLEVNGNLGLTNNGSSYIKFRNNAGTGWINAMATNNSDDNLYLYSKGGGLMIYKQANTLIAAFLEGGNIGIGNASPSYLLTMESSGGGYYSSSDHQWHNGSSRAIKADIKPNEIDIFNVLEELNIVNYRYKSELAQDEDAPYHIGFIAEEAPSLVSGKDHNSMAIGDCIGLLLATAKEQQKKIEALRAEVNDLKSKFPK